MYTLLWEALSGEHAAPTRAAQLLEAQYGESNEGAAKRKRWSRDILILVLDELDYLVHAKGSSVESLAHSKLGI